MNQFIYIDATPEELALAGLSVGHTEWEVCWECKSSRCECAALVMGDPTCIEVGDYTSVVYASQLSWEELVRYENLSGSAVPLYGAEELDWRIVWPRRVNQPQPLEVFLEEPLVNWEPAF